MNQTDEQYKSSRISFFGRAFRLALKELRETLRDRRTIATLVLMPLLVYPLLAVALQRFALTTFREGTDENVFFVGVDPEDQSETLTEFIQFGDQLLRAESSPEKTEPDEQISASIQLFNQTDLKKELAAALKDGEIDLAINVQIVEEPASRGPQRRRRFPNFRFNFEHNPASPRSTRALAFFEKRIRAANVQLLRERLTRRNQNSRVPAEMAFTASAVKGTGIVSLGALVPLILLLMTVTGAVYPAIDLTAGERERGTLEMLISAPVPRIGLLVAKYAAVMTVALLTASVNLVAMTSTIYSIGLEKLLFATGALSPRTIVLVFGLTVLFAAFFSAVLLALTSFARSFKEAQAYLIPLMLVSLAPGMMALMPGVEMNSLLAVTPLVNIVLLARDLFDGNANSLFAAMTVVSTMGYAALALALAGRIFGTDAILYGSQGTWSDMLKAPPEQRSAPQIRTAMFCLALMFPLFILLGNLPGRFESLPITGRLALSSVVSLFLFMGVPLVLAKLRNIEIGSGFRLMAAHPLTFCGAGLMGISLWAFAFNLVSWITDIDEERFAQFAGLIEQVNQAPLWLKLVVLAAVPAIAEEFFFRGFLLNGLRSALAPWKAILLSAFLFGLFHVIVRDRLLFERMVSSTLMGVALGWVCLRTGSVFPGMLLHVLNNGFFMCLSEYKDDLAAMGIGSLEQSMLPAHYLFAAGCVASIGIGLVVIGTRAKPAKAVSGN